MENNIFKLTYDEEKKMREFEAECIKKHKERQRTVDKFNLWIAIGEFIFVGCCLYHLVWGKESVAMWLVLYRISVILFYFSKNAPSKDKIP